MLGSAEGQNEVEGREVPREQTQHMVLVLNPARGGPPSHCFVAGMGVDAVDGWGAAAWGKGLETGAEASEMDLEDGTLAVHQDWGLDLEEAAGCRVHSPEEELGAGSSRPDGWARGRGGIASGGDGDEGLDGDGGCCGGDDGRCCSDGGYCGRDGGAESGDLSDLAGVS